MHDGARPLVTCDEIGRAVDALAADASWTGRCWPSPAIDTIKMVDENGLIVAPPPSGARVWRAQTPQIFRWQALHGRLRAAPDEVLLALPPTTPRWWRRAGGRVAVVEGSPENFKVTDRVDLRHAEQILAERRR